MAKQPTNYTAPTNGILTELWYSTDGSAANLKQVFGVQSIPSAYTAKDDVTYTTLESDTEFATKGRRTYESIEVSCLLYKEQFTALETLAATNTDLTWYIKLPEITGTVISWEGSLDIAMDEITDDMIMCIVKIGKSTVPVILGSLPVASV